MSLEYTRDSARVLYRKQVITLDDGARYLVEFSARDVRRERDGIHARIDIRINNVTLAYSVVNIDRDADRQSLASSAFAQYNQNGVARDYPYPFVKKDLDLFCDGLWDEHLLDVMPERVGGAAVAVRPTFLLEPYIIEGGGSILFAPPGRGKSWTSLLMAVAIDAGLSTPLGMARPARVLFLNMERSRSSFLQRLAAVNIALGLARERELDLLNARGRSLADVYDGCARWVGEHGTACVVLDSLSRAGLGDMNDNLASNRTMDLLNALAPTWFAPAHPPRADASHVFGSQMYDAAADVLIQVLSEQADEGPLGLGLQVTKANEFRAPPLRILAYDFDDFGLVGVRRATAGEFPEIEAGRKANVLADIAEYIKDQDGSVASATDIATALNRNRSHIAHLLAERKDRFVLVRKEGRNALYGMVWQK